MIHPFDIFQIEREGVRWLGSAPSLQDAQAKVQQLAERCSEYLLLNQRTGHKMRIKLESATESLGS
ncbi:MAG: hypothetical protein NVS9B4_28060 [Candidatus Acidiferrum sp.]